MRLPREALVVDTSVLIAAVRGRNIQALTTAAKRRQLLVTSTGVSDAARRIEFGLKAPDRLPTLHATVALMNHVDAETTVIERAALWCKFVIAVFDNQ